MNRRDLIKRGLALTAWLAARQTAAAEASSSAFARLKAAVSGQAAPQPFSPEYIVVGSGAGGGTVAARLAESGFRVLLLEAGGDPRKLQGGDPQGPDRNTLPEDYDVPAFHSLATENEAMRWDFFVRHYKDNDRQRRDPKFRATFADRNVDGVLYPRAGTLGGCTAHNAMIFVYPHNSDWNQIADIAGDSSWRAEHMRTYFERLEDCRHRGIERFWSKLGRNPSRHGWGGWLPTEKAIPSAAFTDDNLRQTIVTSARDALASLGGPLGDGARIESRDDPNDWRVVSESAIGLRYAPMTTDKHARVGTRERLLDIQGRYPARLKIELDALATRVLFDDGNRAVGVEYLKGERLYRAHAKPNAAGGDVRQARASREVILAGGAFNTPQLLMLSGIGPRTELEALRIPVRVDVPGVGRNLQDRYEVAIVNRMSFDEWEALRGATFTKNDPQFTEWSKDRKGVFTTNGVVLSVIARSTIEQPEPDLFCYGLIGRFEGYFPGYSTLVSKNPNCLTWVILKGHTNNTAGSVTLRTADPRDAPAVNFSYFDEGNDSRGQDVRAVVEGVKLARKMAAGLKGRGLAKEELPGEAVASDEAIAEWVKNNAWGHHASCTCPIGDLKNGGVVSGDFKVHGTQGLRIVDASVFPRVPGLFIVSAIYMIGEKAAEVIAKDAGEEVMAATIWGNATRVRYFSGQLLSAGDFRAEQDYVRGKHRLLNRLTFGEGVVSGLGVTIDTASSGNAPVISVAPGVAIAADGEALVLPQPVSCTPAQASASGFVTLGYVERSVSPVPPGGTDADSEAEASRNEEGVAVDFETEIRDNSVRLARLVRGTARWTVDPDFRPATSRHRAGWSSSEG